MEPKNLFLVFLLTFSSLPLSFTQTAQTNQSFMSDAQIDPQLKEICKLTKEPELCLQSYFVYTGEDHPDPSINNKAILRKELEVAKKMSLELYTQSIGFSSQHYGKNKKLYAVFDRCSRMFVLASNELIHAKEALLKKNDMDKVKAGINVAINNYKACGATNLDAQQLYKMADICMSLANFVH